MKKMLGFVTIAALLLSWYLLTATGFVKPIFLPSPVATAQALWDLVISGRFLYALLISFLRIISATLAAVILGSVTGILMGISEKAERLLNPITQPLRYLPITAMIPLLVLWLGIGEAMKITFLLVGIVFYFIPLVRNAIRRTPEEYLYVAKAFGASPWKIIKRVYLPHALPQIFNGVIVVNAIGWNYVILAEIINGQNGLGYLILIAGRLQKSAEVFAGLMLIALIAIISDRLLHIARDRYFFW